MTAPKRKPAPASVFDQTIGINLASISPDFMVPYKRMITYQHEHGRLPGLTYRSADGVEVGRWFQRCQANPHTLTLEQRALLLCVPDVRLSVDPGLARLPMGSRSAAEEGLYRRALAYATNPNLDPGHRRVRAVTRRLRGNTPQRELIRSGETA